MTIMLPDTARRAPTTPPAVGSYRPMTMPAQAEATLTNGLTVIAIRKTGVPLVEVRLWVPFATAEPAPTALLTQTLFAGTSERTAGDIAAMTQSLGGTFTATADADRLQVSGHALATGLDELLAVLSEVLTDAAYPDDKIRTGRSRLADRLAVARNQPTHLVREAVLERIYRDHPYRQQTPGAAAVRQVEPGHLRDLHRARLRPDGATLLLVGDLDPTAIMAMAQRRLGGWRGEAVPIVLPPTPTPDAGPLLLVHRAGSVQSSLRVVMPAAGRMSDDCAPLQLANLIFGGYFCSRWMENIREDKGYSYSPYSRIDHSIAGSNLIAYAEVATAVTAPALVETYYELGRMAALGPSPAEVDLARRYALGALRLAMSTQAGLAALGAGLIGFGLRLDYLARHAARIEAATLEDVRRVAAAYLAPARAVPVILGDNEHIERSIAAILPVRVDDLHAEMTC